MSSTDTITMWTGQTSVVMDEIKRTGRYMVKKEYVNHKYGESAWIFQEAYQYLAVKAENMIERPKGAESPVWVYREAGQIFGGKDVHYLKLCIPANKLILFDSRKWNRILNLNYIGKDEKDEETFEQRMRSRGIHDMLKIFSTGYYPMEKREVKKSWDRLFGDNNIEEAYLQGMTWEICEEWII